MRQQAPYEFKRPQIQRIRAMAEYKGAKLTWTCPSDDHPTISISAPGHGPWVIGKFWPTDFENALKTAQKLLKAAQAKGVAA